MRQRAQLLRAHSRVPPVVKQAPVGVEPTDIALPQPRLAPHGVGLQTIGQQKMAPIKRKGHVVFEEKTYQPILRLKLALKQRQVMLLPVRVIPKVDELLKPHKRPVQIGPVLRAHLLKQGVPRTINQIQTR